MLGCWISSVLDCLFVCSVVWIWMIWISNCIDHCLLEFGNCIGIWTSMDTVVMVSSHLASRISLSASRPSRLLPYRLYRVLPVASPARNFCLCLKDVRVIGKLENLST